MFMDVLDTFLTFELKQALKTTKRNSVSSDNVLMRLVLRVRFFFVSPRQPLDLADARQLMTWASKGMGRNQVQVTFTLYGGEAHKRIYETALENMDRMLRFDAWHARN